MLIKLTEVCGSGTASTSRKYSLREVFINPEHVVMVREDHQIRSLNENGLITEDLDKGHRFSKVVIDKGSAGSEIIVIGDPLAVEKLLNTRNYVLRG